MKHILILLLLLFASVAAGQTVSQVDTTEWIPDGNGHLHRIVRPTIYRPDGKITHARFSDSISWRPVTVHDLKEYAKECYADSTVTRVSAPCPEGRIGCLVDHGYYKAWTHREPTFKGFIDFLWRQK